MKNIKSQLILFLFLIGQNILVKAQFDEQIAAKVDAYLKTQSEQFHGTILLAVGDKILMNKGYGMADYSHNIANSADTKYLIGSTTKHFTAVMILQLVEKGLIDLDDSIDEYFPNGPVEK
ncbi:MAG: serine hydrolase domain-containing protein, partial [Anaerolineales bacterium]